MGVEIEVVVVELDSEGRGVVCREMERIALRVTDWTRKRMGRIALAKAGR